MAVCPNRRRVRVAIVDDHLLWREAVRCYLERVGGIELVGAVGEGAAAMRLLDKYRPEVLLLDVHPPDLSGIEVARAVRAGFPDVAVLVLSGYNDPGWVHTLLRQGARGFPAKAASGPEIVAAIWAAARGETVAASSDLRAMPRDEAEALSPRELQVLGLLASGRRNAEIAQELVVSMKTVEFHVSNILSKLGARSRTEAIARARRRGLTWPEPPDDDPGPGVTQRSC